MKPKGESKTGMTPPADGAPVLPAWDSLGRVLREATSARAGCESIRLGDFAFRHGSGATEPDSPIYLRSGQAGDEA